MSFSPSQNLSSTAIGRSVLNATDAAAARGVIGAGASNLALGATSSTARAGDWLPNWTDLQGTPILDSLPLAISGTITWTGTSWPARTTATSQTARHIFFVGNPGGSGPTDMQENDIWTQG